MDLGTINVLRPNRPKENKLETLGKLYEANKGPKAFKVFSEGYHAYSCFEEGYFEVIKNFIDNYVK